MIRRQFLIGISTAALCTGTAAAQNPKEANGNFAREKCAPGNSCQVNNQWPGSNRNLGFIRQTDGTGNFGLIDQQGDDNFSTIEQSEDLNEAAHRQVGYDHSSATTQAGKRNSSFVTQNNENNSAAVSQTGSDNVSSVEQGASLGGEGEFQSALGGNNLAIVTQTGANLVSEVTQAAYSFFGNDPSAEENRATVLQSGAGSESYIAQISRGNSATVRMSEGGPSFGEKDNPTNISELSQGNIYYRLNGDGNFIDDEGGPSEFNNPLSGNVANVSIRGRQNYSGLMQNGVGNGAVVSMSGGGGGRIPAGRYGPSGKPLSAGDVEGNDVYVRQIGAGNSAEVVAKGLGNESSIRQGDFGRSALGTNHRAIVNQGGVLDNVVIRQDNNSGTITSSSGTDILGTMPADQDGSIAHVTQLSINSTALVAQRGTNTAIAIQGANPSENGGDNLISIDQTDAGDTGASVIAGIFAEGPTGLTPQRNFAHVTQYGIGNTASVTQNGVNARATVLQTLGSRANAATILQGAGGLAAGASGAGAPANNLTLTASITQRGPGSTARIAQSGQFLSATVNQVQSGLWPAQGEVGAFDNVARISQVASNSTATVTQEGFLNLSIVDQRGNGTAARPNRVTITQMGDRHRATAIQEVTSGASGPGDRGTYMLGGNKGAFPRARAAGAASAEIEIFQSGSAGSAKTGPASKGNSATIRQQGLGQLAVIDQRGRDNVAGILQSPTATNAVAIIEQTGDSNSFFISQAEAGQYMRVTQTGGGNVSSTSASGGAPAGGTGSRATPPPGLY